MKDDESNTSESDYISHRGSDDFRRRGDFDRGIFVRRVESMSFVSYLIGILILLLIGKAFHIVMSILVKLIVSAVVGGVLLWAFNLFAAGTSFYLEITPLRAFLVGVLGPVGLLGILLYQGR